MKKIAFIIICKNQLNKVKIWEEFFKNNYDKCNIYIHCTDLNITQEFVKKHHIGKKIPSEWGDLYGPLKYMLKLAYDNDDYKFVLISDSTIPVKKFSYIYDKLISNEKTYLCYQPHKIVENNEKFTLRQSYQRYIFNMMNNKNFVNNISINHWYYGECWMIYNRMDAYLIINDNKYYDIFKNCFAYDENYPAYLLSINNRLCNVINQMTTFVNWSEPEIEENGHRHPKKYNKMKKSDIEILKKSDYFFARKFSVNSDIDNYINEIWNN